MQYLFAVTSASAENALLARPFVPIALLALFWGWESWRPFFGQPNGRVKHAAHNLAIAVLNTLVLAAMFGTVTVFLADWTARNGYGLLNLLDAAGPVRFALSMVLLDGWMYAWHRANHLIPLLWRFHRMHHSDRNMDVTTATRFHLGEHIGSSVLRLGLIPLVGLDVLSILAYETLVVAFTQFHHADISIGAADRWLRLVVVTPDMHKVHHSDQLAETNSNYSTILSFWDRVARTLKMRDDPEHIVFGLTDFTEPSWQTWWGMLWTPLANLRNARSPGAASDKPAGL